MRKQHDDHVGICVICGRVASRDAEFRDTLCNRCLDLRREAPTGRFMWSSIN